MNTYETLEKEGVIKFDKYGNVLIPDVNKLEEYFRNEVKKNGTIKNR